MNVLNRINEIKNSYGWSLYKLSEESGISQSTLSNMFSRNTNPSITTLSMICDAFGITLSEFFNTENKKISIDETLLLTNYKKLSNKDRKVVLSLIDTLIKENNNS